MNLVVEGAFFVMGFLRIWGIVMKFIVNMLLIYVTLVFFMKLN